MRYINKRFLIENISVTNLAKKFDTPIYCYSYKKLKLISLVLNITLDLLIH